MPWQAPIRCSPAGNPLCPMLPVPRKSREPGGLQMSSYHRPVVLAGLVAVGIGAATPARAHHNDWGAPLIGGALGGYALGTLVANSRQRTEDIYEPAPAPDYYAPAPTYAPTPSAGS